MSIHEQEIDALLEGRFELAPLLCTLEQEASASPEVLSGAGLVRQLPNGLPLELAFLCTERPASSLTSKWVVGAPVPTDAYYNLTAEDIRGRTWRAQSIVPHFMLQYGADRLRATAVATVHALETTESISTPLTRNGVELHILGNLGLPGNARTRTLKEEGQYRTERNAHNLAVVDLGDYHVELTQWDARARLSCTSARDLAKDLDASLVEALQFVAGMQLREAVCVRRERDRETFRLCSRGLRPRPTRQSPPIPPNAVESGKFVWELFTRYLDHSLREPARGHALSTVWDGVLRAQQDTLDTQALVYSVAVEGLLDILEVPPLTGDAVQQGDALYAKWASEILKFLADAGCTPEMRERFQRRLGRPDRKSPASRLRELANRQLIDPDLIESWTDTRHRVVHGKKVGEANWEQAVRNCDAILTLLLQMTFAAIEYEGPYENKVRVPWSIDRYPYDPGAKASALDRHHDRSTEIRTLSGD